MDSPTTRPKILPKPKNRVKLAQETLTLNQTEQTNLDNKRIPTPMLSTNMDKQTKSDGSQLQVSNTDIVSPNLRIHLENKQSFTSPSESNDLNKIPTRPKAPSIPPPPRNKLQTELDNNPRRGSLDAVFNKSSEFVSSESKIYLNANRIEIPRIPPRPKTPSEYPLSRSKDKELVKIIASANTSPQKSIIARPPHSSSSDSSVHPSYSTQVIPPRPKTPSKLSPIIIIPVGESSLKDALKPKERNSPLRPPRLKINSPSDKSNGVPLFKRSNTSSPIASISKSSDNSNNSNNAHTSSLTPSNISPRKSICKESPRSKHYFNFTVPENYTVQIHHTEIKQFSTNVLQWLASISKEDDYTNTFDTDCLLGSIILTDDHMTTISNQLKYKISTQARIDTLEILPLLGSEFRQENPEMCLSLFISVFSEEAPLNPPLSFNVTSVNTPEDLIQLCLQDQMSNEFSKEGLNLRNFILRVAGLDEYMKHPKTKLLRYQYILSCVRQREYPQLVLVYIPNLIKKLFECEDPNNEELDNIISSEDFFNKEVGDVIRTYCPERLYFNLCQVSVVFETFILEIKKMKKFGELSNCWLSDSGKMQTLQQTISLLSNQLGKFNPYSIEMILDILFKSNKRVCNRGLAEATRLSVFAEAKFHLNDLEYEVREHIDTFSNFLKVPISYDKQLTTFQNSVYPSLLHKSNIVFSQNRKTNNMQIWFGGLHRITRAHYTSASKQPCNYLLEVVLMCGKNEIVHHGRSMNCKLVNGRFYKYLLINTVIDIGATLQTIPKETYLSVTISSTVSDSDNRNMTILAKGYMPIYDVNVEVNKRRRYIPMADKHLAYPYEYLTVDFTTEDIQILELEIEESELEVYAEIRSANLISREREDSIVSIHSNSSIQSEDSLRFGSGSTLSTISDESSCISSFSSSSGSSSSTTSSFVSKLSAPPRSQTQQLQAIKRNSGASDLSQQEEEYTSLLMKKDMFYPLSRYDRSLLWSQRHRSNFPKNLCSLALLCQAMPYNDVQGRRELRELLSDWPKQQSPALMQLLGPLIWQIETRNWAIDNLSLLQDESLCLVVPQLVSATMLEKYHWSHLIEVILQKSKGSLKFCHSLFWTLTTLINTSYIQGEIRVRLLLVRASILAAQPNMVRKNFAFQLELMVGFEKLALSVRSSKEELRKIILKQGLFEMKKMLPDTFSLPMATGFKSSGFDLEKSSYFNSNAVPLNISFSNSDCFGTHLQLMFKCGDDLRQDRLVLQIVTLMDFLWQSYGLEMQMLVFNCVPTGNNAGLLELVKNCKTLREIQTQVGLIGSFATAPLAQWLHRYNPSEELYRQAVDTFMRSCAGWCVASYVLGLCDRHNDNIMLTKQGHIFHIDFGKILGNAQMFGKIKRDRAPFVLTPDMVYVIDGCDHGTVMFQRFIDLCCHAYNILRDHIHLILGMLMLMLPAKLELLTTLEDIKFVREQLKPNFNHEEATCYFTSLIRESRASLSTRLNFLVHSVAQLRSGKSNEEESLLSFIPGNYSKHRELKILSAGLINFQKKYHPEKFYSYLIEVVRDDKNIELQDENLDLDISAQSTKEVIFRRYREFYELHSKLQEAFSEVQLPSLPGKLLIGRSAIKTVAQSRYPELKRYLNELLSMDPRLSQSDLIYTFLHATLRDRQDIVQFSLTHSQFCITQGVTGRIPTLETKVKLNINYFTDRRMLSVMVIHVRGLCAENKSGITLYEGLPTTKVKLKLNHANSFVEKRKTQTVSNCPNPTFNEYFSLQISEFDISDAALEVLIKEMRLKLIIYSTVIPLKYIKSEGRNMQWYNLKHVP